MVDVDKDYDQGLSIDASIKHIYNAIQKGDEQFLCAYLKAKNINILNQNIDGKFPIHTAVLYGQLECVKVLVQFANHNGVNFLDIWDQALTFHPCIWSPLRGQNCKQHVGPETQPSLLSIAVQLQYLLIVEYLVPFYKEKNRERNKEDPGIYEAICEALADSKILSYLLNAFSFCANKYLNTLNELLHKAVLCEFTESMGVLINQGADVESLLATDHYTLSVLQRAVEAACKSGYTDVLKLLIKSGVNVNSMCDHNPLLDVTDSDISVPLFMAVYKGSFEVVKFLIENGADPYIFKSVTMERFGQTNACYNASAIFIAAFGKKIRILQYLVEVVDIRRMGQHNLSSPVLAAAIRYSPECLEVLLKAGYAADGTLPCCNVLLLKHPCQSTMFDNLNLFIDDTGDIQQPIYRVLNTLLSRGIKFTKSVNEIFIKNVIFDLASTSSKSLALFVHAGAIEYAFGKDNTTRELKVFIKSIWKYIVALHNQEHILENEPLICHRNYETYIKNFNILFNCIKLYKIRNFDDDTIPLLDVSVPSLQEICRYVIRSTLIQKHHNLILLNEVKLPPVLIEYLMIPIEQL